VVEQDVSSTTLESLISSTEYEVRVRGENTVGRSDPSATKWTKTKADSELSTRSEFPGVQMEHLTMLLSLLQSVDFE